MAPRYDPKLGPYPNAVRKFPSVRQSTLAAFDSCSLSAKFESDYRQGWSTHPQARGSIFHRVAADCLRTMHSLGEEQIPVDVALAHLHEALRQDDIDRQCPKCKSTKIRRGIKEGLRTCGACGNRFPTELMNVPMDQVKDLYWVVKKWAHDNRWTIANLMEVEQRLTVPIGYPDGRGGTFVRNVTGQLDAVFLGDDVQHAVVLDWKDTWALPGPTGISFEGYFQQRMYGWLIMRTYPNVNRVTLREFYVRKSEPREVTLWREDLDDVEQEFTALVERFDRFVHQGTFTPSPGKHCGWCLRPAACPILPEARDVGRIRSPAEAEKITRQWTVAKSVVDQTGRSLRNYTDVHGPIPIRDAKGVRVLGYQDSEREERPTREQVEQAMREAGPDGLVLDDLFRKHKSTRFGQFVPPREKPTDEDAALLAEMEGALVAARQARES